MGTESLHQEIPTWECLKWDRIIWPMFWVWDKSRAASTSSRMYSGAGLNSSMARIRDSATSDLKIRHTIGRVSAAWQNALELSLAINFIQCSLVTLGHCLSAQGAWHEYMPTTPLWKSTKMLISAHGKCHGYMYTTLLWKSTHFFNFSTWQMSCPQHCFKSPQKC